MLRVLHISDLHAVGSPTTSADVVELAKAFIDDIQSLHSARPIEVIVMSGDLSFSGQASEFATAHETVLRPLLEALQIPKQRVVLVPGNHDVDRSRINVDLDAGLRSNVTSREYLNDLFADSERLAGATTSLASWRTFYSTFYGGDLPEAIPPLGRFHEIETAHGVAGVAALNTAWRSSGDDDRGFLLLGDQQVRVAFDRLEGADLQLLVFHHPLEWLTTWDADELRVLIGKRRAVVLTGHDHLADPVLETTVRGTTLFSRGASLFEKFDSANGYEVVDIDIASRRTRFTLRAWQRERREFDAAVNRAENGVLEVEWPRPTTELVVQADVPYSTVMSNLSEIVQARSIIADYLSEKGEVLGVDDVLVSPRLWPLPYREGMIAAKFSDSPRPRRIENRELIETGQPVILSGDRESGVTGSLLWLLARHYESDASRLPVYVAFTRRLTAYRLRQHLRAEIQKLGLHLDQDEPLPPLTVAIDDVTGASPRALAILARYVAEHREHHYLLGCHGEMHDSVAQTLTREGVEARVAYLGPFGRKELRTFIEKLAGGPSSDLVERVLKIIRSERLPRNPFVITALVTVILKNIELAEVNESSLLDAYVSFLLGRSEPYDPRGLDMDFRRREHLLSMLALRLDTAGTSALPRLDSEEFVARYFRDRDWGARSSPGKLVEDLIGRRILYEDGEGNVGFRHPAFRDLFAGKAMLDDVSFAQRMIASPLDNAGAIRHAAGLRRSDPTLLRDVAGATRPVMEDAARGITVASFDAIKQKPGWSRDDPDLEVLRRRLEIPPPEPPAEEELDEQVDAYHDQLEYENGADTEREAHPVDAAWMTASFLGAVLRNSELVDDVELKTEVLKTVIGDWALFAVMAAVREDQEGFLRERLAEVAAEAGETPDRDRIAWLVELILAFVTVVAVQGALGTFHLEGTVKRALDDREFMAETAHALLTTMLYAALGTPDWTERLGELYKKHRDHPVVAELTRTYVLVVYRFRDLGDDELGKVEELLADVYAPMPSSGRGRPLAMVRNEQRMKVIHQLRKRRLADRQGEIGAESIEDVLDSDGDTDEPVDE